jgi:hypothetical protein
MRLVEICVDGGLEATMYAAQAQLADAYLAAGAASEARFIAEDLVAREPWDRANIERFRRSLVLLGEADPDQVIADRLSGQSPFQSTDTSLRGDGLPAFDSSDKPAASATPAQPEPPLEETPEQAPAIEPAIEPTLEPTETVVAAAEEAAVFSPADPPASSSIDLQRLLGPTAHGRKKSVEVDLSIVLDNVGPSATVAPVPATAAEPLPPPGPASSPAPAPTPAKPIASRPAPDLEGVFAQ